MKSWKKQDECRDTQHRALSCSGGVSGGRQVDQVYFPHIEVIGDIANALWQMSEALEGCELQWDLQCALFPSVAFSENQCMPSMMKQAYHRHNLILCPIPCCAVGMALLRALIKRSPADGADCLNLASVVLRPKANSLFP